MSFSINTTYDNTAIVNSDIVIPNIVRFWLYIVFLVPSIICTLFLLFYFLSDRKLRRTLHNHSIVLLLFIGLLLACTDVPWFIHYYRFELALSQTRVFCLVWSYIDWAIYESQLMLFAWAAAERYILVFHDRWMFNRKKRFFIHYFPMILILLYSTIYYIPIVLFPPCNNIFDYSVSGCVKLCVYENPIALLWELLFNEILPTLIIAVSSIMILFRIIRQERRMRRQVYRRKFRYMAIQLLSLSVLACICFMPYMVIELFNRFGVKFSNLDNILELTLFFMYFFNILFPFICLGSLPKVQNFVKRLLQCRHQWRTVAPGILVDAHTANNQTAAVFNMPH